MCPLQYWWLTTANPQCTTGMVHFSRTAVTVYLIIVRNRCISKTLKAIYVHETYCYIYWQTCCKKNYITNLLLSLQIQNISESFQREIGILNCLEIVTFYIKIRVCRMPITRILSESKLLAPFKQQCVLWKYEPYSMVHRNWEMKIVDNQEGRSFSIVEVVLLENS